MEQEHQHYLREEKISANNKTLLLLYIIDKHGLKKIIWKEKLDNAGSSFTIVSSCQMYK